MSARALARQTFEDEFLHPAIASIAREEISVLVGDQDVQAQEHPGMRADMAERCLRNLLQCLAVQHTDFLLMTFADIEKALIFVA